MKRKYNTLNEEMNRMKSLFGESRLYGNIVDKKEEIITEQYGFFRNLDSLFKVSLKSFDDLGTFTKFVNREISNVDDIIKHFDEFNALWRVLLPNVKNWTGLENNLKKLKKITDSGNLNTISKDEWINEILPGFPKKGGMYDMVNDMWRKANGKNPLLPQNVQKQEIAVTTKNELVVGTDVNGVIVYKNDAGNIIPAEQIKQISDAEEVKYFDIDRNEIDVDDVNYKDGETKLYDELGNEINKNGEKVGVDEAGTTVYNKNNEEVGVVDRDGNIIDSEGNIVDSEGKIITKKSDRIEDATIVEVPDDSTIDDLNGKKVAPTNENAEEVLKASEKVANENPENVVTFTITGKGKDGIKSAEEMLDSLTNRGGGNGSVDEVVDETIKKTEETLEIPAKDIPAYRKFLKNWFTKWPSKFWFNPMAIGEGRMKGFADFSIDPATGKQKYSPADKFAQISLYAGSVSLRTLVINPLTLFTLWTSYRTLNKDRSFIAGVMEDFAVLGKAFWDFWEDVKLSNDVLDGLKRTVIQVSDGKIDPDVVVDNMNKAAVNAITGATSGDSFISCDEIMGKNNEEICKLSFSKIKGEEKARVGKILQVGGTDPEVVNEIKTSVENLIDWVVEHNGTNKNLDNIINKTRKNCLSMKEDDELNQKVIEGDYEVIVEGGATI